MTPFAFSLSRHFLHEFQPPFALSEPASEDRSPAGMQHEIDEPASGHLQTCTVLVVEQGPLVDSVEEDVDCGDRACSPRNDHRQSE
jgi:hypothetical protein